MKKEIDPKLAFVGLGLVVVLVSAFFFIRSSQQPAQVDVKNLPREEIEDVDPPKRGQPGYRERITDPPAP
jgi:hypothetical protein